MPGNILSFHCPCGFKKSNITVGVSEDFVNYSAFLCLNCKKIIPVLKRRGGSFNVNCHICGTKFVTLTEPGAWMPVELQQRFPDSEPWMIENSIFNLEEEEAEKLMSLAEEIRVLCPRCGKHSLRFEETGLWD
jgi:transcription elongation factor Elf1